MSFDRQGHYQRVVDSGRIWLQVDLGQQRLKVRQGSQLVREYPISSAAKGAGELHGSNRTPRGWHVIRAKIGDGAPSGAVFVGRRPTGEIYSEELAQQHPDRDWILTRILWLSGLERGYNRLGNRDTMRRYIYIHGCPDSTPMGQPGSAGCVRMRNADVIELFEQVEPGTPVLIHE
ncbi:MAG: L,D-transpeptidase [Xanthomonadaceae bacterium]|nr:L,D-transpeptidase [Xanthomonadaceae bacterium]